MQALARHRVEAAGPAAGQECRPPRCFRIHDRTQRRAFNLLTSNGGILLQKTPLWYYILREAKVLGNGNQLGPVGARIVAETFVRMLKRDASSYLNVTGGFTPMLPSAIPNDFTVADLVNFAGVTDGGDGSQTLRVTASSGNTALIPSVTVSYSPDSPTGSLSFARTGILRGRMRGWKSAR